MDLGPAPSAPLVDTPTPSAASTETPAAVPAAPSHSPRSAGTYAPSAGTYAPPNKPEPHVTLRVVGEEVVTVGRRFRWFPALAMILVGCSTADGVTTPPAVPSSSGTSSTTSSLSPPVTYGPATLVSGTVTFTVSEGTHTQDADGVSSHSRHGTFTETLTSSDPRVSGEFVGSWNMDHWSQQAGEALTQWGTARLTNAGGTWTGPYSGIYTSETGDMITRWCQGSGGYKGLTFYMWLVVPRATVDSGPAHWQGLVFPGNPPAH